MKIYISGKITGLVFEDAMLAFCEAENELLNRGHEPVNPMKKVSEQAGLDWVDYMKEDIPILLGCDGIYMLANWPDSKGARLELHIAEELGMTVIYAPNAVKSWEQKVLADQICGSRVFDLRCCRKKHHTGPCSTAEDIEVTQ